MKDDELNTFDLFPAFQFLIGSMKVKQQLIETKEKIISIPYRLNESRFVDAIKAKTYDCFIVENEPVFSSIPNHAKNHEGRHTVVKLLLYNTIILVFKFVNASKDGRTIIFHGG